MGQLQNYNAALYLRYSKDEQGGESSSIGTQKDMLTQYCKSKNINVYDCYIDDGFTGTNFQRPSFQRMIEDIERGKINCVIVKDLSRLGRHYLETGTYIEIYFPNNGVRFIALNDNVDSLNSSTMDITPYKNLLNDMYAKDISKKVKTAIVARQKQGKYIGTKAPFGYVKDPEDHNHLIVDERYAPVVRKIYALAKEGLGIARIRNVMIEEKIPRPAARMVEDGHNFANCNLETEESRCNWSNNSVREILRSPVYAGHIAGQKRPTVSMKSVKRRRFDPDLYFVVENCHEPIIPPEEWELVQRLITARLLGKMGSYGYDNIFAGLIKCADCGKAMTSAGANRRKRPDVIDCVQYSCNNYRTFGKAVCSIHALEARDLHNAVLADIQKHARAALENDKKMLDRIIRQLNLNTQKELDSTKREYGKARSRLAKLDELFSKLYEDRVNGAINERNYQRLSANYEHEQNELEIKLRDFEQDIDKGKADMENAGIFVQSIKEYAEITELTAPLLNRLIDRITVSERMEIDGECVQKLCIYYKFVGCLEQATLHNIKCTVKSYLLIWLSGLEESSVRETITKRSKSFDIRP